MEQVGLDGFFQRVALFGETGGDGLNPDGAALVVFGDVVEVAAVGAVEAELVDFQALEAGMGDVFGDG